jgi:hypothetical protein
VLRHSPNTIEDLQKILFGYRDNRVEVEQGVPITAKAVANLRALPTWPDGLALTIHIDLDPPIERRGGGAGTLVRVATPS